MKKALKKILAVVLAITVAASVSVVGFAAADPNVNRILVDYTDSTDWKATYTDSQTSRSYVNFSTVDANDTEHGEVVKYHYLSGTTMGGVIRIPDAFKSVSPNRILSLDFYVYDNTIPYEIRLMGYENETSSTGGNIGQVNVNYGNFSSTEVNKNAKIGVMDAGQSSGAEKATVEVTNKEWHKFDAIMTADEINYYIDGTYLGASIVPDSTKASSYNYFSSVQMVTRAGYQASTVEEKSGLYIDNLKLSLYEEDAKFYGEATASESEITVEFSESILATSAKNFSSIKVYNTKTQQKISTGEPVLKDINTLVIPLNEKPTEFTEHLIEMPDNLTGISGKTLFGDIYFITSGSSEKEYMNEGFTDYTTIPSTNTTDVVSPGPQWFGAGFVNTKASGDTNHGNILYAGNIANNTGNNPIRFAVKLGGNDVIDVSKGEASVEFDMKLVNPNYTDLYVMPYSTIDGVTDDQLANSAVNSNQPTKPSHFCGLSFSGSSIISAATEETGGKAWVQMRVQDAQVVAAQAYGTLKVHGGYRYKLIPVNDWYKIKITIDKSSGVPMIKTYVDNELLYASTATQNFSGASATNFLRGIRFTMYVPTGSSTVTEDYIHIDNVVFKGPQSSASVKKIRICNIDGESFGPMSTGVKASAEKADIYFTEKVDTTNASVYLTDGSNDINTKKKPYDAESNKLTVIFDDVMKKETKYTLTVTGVKTMSGEAVPDASAVFTTGSEGEFIIDGLTLTDESGNVIEGTGYVNVNDVIHPAVKIINTLDEDKTALVVGTVFNDITMINTRSKSYDIPANSKIVVTDDISMKVESVEDLVLNAMVWDSFDSNKPIADIYVLDR